MTAGRKSYARWSVPGLIILSWLGAAGCAATASVPGFESAEAVVISAEDERGLWHQSEEFDERIRYMGVLYGDAALRAYLQEVTIRLFPEFGGAMRVSVLISHVPNAFVIPNGSVYVDEGLLAFLDNEAQLAAILAHEGSHFVNRHSLRQTRSAKQSLALGSVIGIGTGMGSLTQILAYSSMMGYSRDLEREADAEGFRRLIAAGYDSAEAVKVFARMARQAQAMDYDEPVFFSSHPSMRERVASYRALSAGTAPGGRVAAEEFLRATRQVTLSYLDNAVERGDYRSIIFLLESEDRLSQLDGSSAYYLGEAYRIRREPGDEDRAETLYRRALAAAPDHASSHGALGRLLMREGRAVEAREHLERYLELRPDAPDRRYVEGYLAELAGGGP